MSMMSGDIPTVNTARLDTIEAETPQHIISACSWIYTQRVPNAFLVQF